MCSMSFNCDHSQQNHSEGEKKFDNKKKNAGENKKTYHLLTDYPPSLYQV